MLWNEFIVEAACGAVSHTYTTQIDDNRSGCCTCILACKRLLEGDVKRVLIHYRGLASIGLVPCVMVSRSIVVHWDGSWSESHPWSAVLSTVVRQVRTGRALSIAAPRQRVPYPTLL